MSENEKLREALELCVKVIEGFTADSIAEGVHSGLRNGTDAPDASQLWRAISASESSAWMDACRWAIDPHFTMWGGNKALAAAKEALSTPPSKADADDVERVATAIGYALCELEEDTLAHGLTLEEWRTLARAALSAIQNRAAGLRETLSEILDFADQSSVNEYARCPECSDIERIARAALQMGGEKP